MSIARSLCSIRGVQGCAEHHKLRREQEENTVPQPCGLCSISPRPLSPVVTLSVLGGELVATSSSRAAGGGRIRSPKMGGVQLLRYF